MSSFITVIKIAGDKEIAKAGSAEYTVDLSRFNCEGFFSLQIEIKSGMGNVDVVWSMSNDGVNFITPSGTDDIFSAYHTYSGPGSNGKDIASFDPMIAKFLKITITENNVESVVVSAHLAIQ